MERTLSHHTDRDRCCGGVTWRVDEVAGREVKRWMKETMLRDLLARGGR